jgi:hypothetical protein
MEKAEAGADSQRKIGSLGRGGLALALRIDAVPPCEQVACALTRQRLKYVRLAPRHAICSGALPHLHQDYRE